jgi:hypothetical protein
MGSCCSLPAAEKEPIIAASDNELSATDWVPSANDSADALSAAVRRSLVALSPVLAMHKQLSCAAEALEAQVQTSDTPVGGASTASRARLSYTSSEAMAGISKSSIPKWPRRGQYCCFLSHYKREAATEARLLQLELEKVLGGPVFIDSDDLKDLRLLTHHVRNSDVLVLLLTENFLTRPWCLIEIWTAINEGIPIVALNVRRTEREGAHATVAPPPARLCRHVEHTACTGGVTPLSTCRAHRLYRRCNASVDMSSTPPVPEV